MRTRCLRMGAALIALLAMVGLASLAQPVAPLGIIVEPPAPQGLEARIWVDQAAYTIGTYIRIHFEVSQDAYVYIWDVDPTGGVCLIYPNSRELDNHVSAGTHTVPGPGLGDYLQVSEPTGNEYLQIVATRTSVDAIVQYFGGFTPGNQFSCSPAGRQAASQMESVKSQIVAAVPENARAFNFTGFEVIQGSVPSSGMLSVTSYPSGALVSLDGRLFGYTPVTQPVRAGLHQVVLSKSGYRDWSTTAMVLPGQTTPINKNLEPIGTINQPPIASFNYSPPNPTVGGFVVFDGSASHDPDGNIVSNAWTFGDGATGTGASVAHQYTMAGTYAVTLTVRDNLGASGTTTRNVQVGPVNQSPVAQFNYSPASPAVGATVGFDASGSYDLDGFIATYAWTFGDGWTGSGRVASHPYSNPGSYTVTLTVTDNLGATATAAQTVYVSAANLPPVATFTYSPLSPLVGESITLNATGSYDPDGWIVTHAWDLDGNGVNDASGPIVAVRYYSTGTRMVRLTVTDNAGLSTTSMQSIVVGTTGGGTTGAPAMDGTPGVFVWGTTTWHVTVNAGATWTSAHNYRLELRTDGSFQNVNRSTTGGVSPLGIVPTPIDSGKTLLFEGSLGSGGVSPLGIIPTPIASSVDYTFTLSSSSTYIWMSLKLDIDGNGVLEESPGFVYLRAHMVHPPTAPFVVGLGYGGSGPLIPSMNFWVGYMFELGLWRFPMYQIRISDLEGI